MRIKIARLTLGEAATGVMRENVKREIVTHHALCITCSASRASLAARRFHWYRRGLARRRTAMKIAFIWENGEEVR